MPCMRTIALLAFYVFATAAAAAQSSWMPIIPNRAIYGLAVNPQNPRTVFAGNMARTLFRTTDGGSTWEELSVQSSGGSSLMSCLLIHPVDTNVVFAAGIGFDGIDRSTDEGVTWQNVLRDPSGFRMEFVGESIVTHPAEPDTMYAIRNAPGIVYRSTDRGETWDSLSAVPTAVGTDRFRAITVAPDSTNIVLVAGRVAFMYRSTDGGRTFVRGPRLTGHPDSEVSLFRWSPTTPGTVYATVQYSLAQNVTNGGLMKSTDWGVTWTRIAHTDVSLYALEVFRGAIPTDPEVIFVGGNQPPLSPAQIMGDSLAFRSIDGGGTWQAINDVPWTENEVMETNTNVWAIRKIEHQGTEAIMLASEAGAFLSSPLATVRHATSDHNASPLRVRMAADGLITLRLEGGDGPATVDLLAVDGGLVGSFPVTLHQGIARVHPHGLASGVYIVALRYAAGTASTRILRY